MDKKLLVQIVGAVFILIGLLGFINNPVLGLFGVDALHNLIHIVSGALAFYLVKDGEKGAVMYGKIMTVVYGLVTVLGLLLTGPDHKLLGILTINGPDNVLHLVLTAVFAYIGFVGVKGVRKAEAK